LQYQIRGGHEARLDTRHHRPIGQSDSRVALAHAARSEQHDVLGALDEGQCRQLLELTAQRAGCEGEVVLLKCLDRRERGQLEQRLACALAAPVQFGCEQALQEIGKARLVGGRLLGQMRPILRDALKLEALA
jgi:hypothetical protein